jgi:peptidyl-dipeptidase Dcp
MRKLINGFVGMVMTLEAAARVNQNPMKSDNPFFYKYKTPFQVLPFDIIKPEHFIPALEEGFRQQSAEMPRLIIIDTTKLTKWI